MIFPKIYIVVSCYLIGLLIFSCKDRPKDYFINLDKNATDSIFTPRLRPVILSEYVKEDLKNWLNFDKVKESMNLIGFVKSFTKTNSIAILSSDTTLNNTYQVLYYQITALYENVTKLEKSIYPSHLDNKSVKSRVILLKTYVSRLKSQMENNIGLTNDNIIRQIDDIFESYNGLVREIGRKYNKTLKVGNIESLLTDDGSLPNVE